MKILVLNGPNLNMLGKREPEIYGKETLQAIEKKCIQKAKENNFEIDFKQSNHEGQLVDWIQESIGKYDALIINAGAYTHTSVAILDALKMLNIPIIEVHLSNIFQREDFRKQSYISLVATGIMSGFGSVGYLLAIEYLAIKNNLK